MSIRENRQHLEGLIAAKSAEIDLLVKCRVRSHLTERRLKSARRELAIFRGLLVSELYPNLPTGA